MNSGSSTEARGATDPGLQAWHFYLLLSMAGAIWAVVVARDTHPAALLLISAAVVAAGVTAAALHYALTGFLGTRRTAAGPALDTRTREALGAEKALVLRSIKELEFDHAMRKVGDADFAEIGGRLRARALELMRDLDHLPETPVVTVAADEGTTAEPAARSQPATTTGPAEGVFARLGGEDDRARPVCGVCGVENDADARFCKSCGARVA